jgi:exodeoxyribonuclease V gamma subunit
MATKTSALYAQKRTSGESNALSRAETEWSGTFPEREDAAYARVWGAEADLAELCVEPAEPGSGERTRFGEIAVRVWQPLLDHEVQVRV